MNATTEEKKKIRDQVCKVRIGEHGPYLAPVGFDYVRGQDGVVRPVYCKQKQIDY